MQVALETDPFLVADPEQACPAVLGVGECLPQLEAEPDQLDQRCGTGGDGAHELARDRRTGGEDADALGPDRDVDPRFGDLEGGPAGVDDVPVRWPAVPNHERGVRQGFPQPLLQLLGSCPALQRSRDGGP